MATSITVARPRDPSTVPDPLQIAVGTWVALVLDAPSSDHDASKVERWTHPGDDTNLGEVVAGGVSVKLIVESFVEVLEFTGDDAVPMIWGNAMGSSLRIYVGGSAFDPAVIIAADLDDYSGPGGLLEFASTITDAIRETRGEAAAS